MSNDELNEVDKGYAKLKLENRRLRAEITEYERSNDSLHEQLKKANTMLDVKKELLAQTESRNRQLQDQVISLTRQIRSINEPEQEQDQSVNTPVNTESISKLLNEYHHTPHMYVTTRTQIKERLQKLGYNTSGLDDK